MVIRPPYVNQAVKSTFKFIMMISDIGRQISRHAIVADYHAVLIIAIGRRTKPERPVLFVDIPVVLQNLHRRPNGIRMKRPLAEPVVKRHMEGLQIFPECRQLFHVGQILENRQALFLVHIEIFIAFLIDNALSRINDILSMITILRELRFTA